MQNSKCCKFQHPPRQKAVMAHNLCKRNRDESTLNSREHIKLSTSFITWSYARNEPCVLTGYSISCKYVRPLGLKERSSRRSTLPNQAHETSSSRTLSHSLRRDYILNLLMIARPTNSITLQHDYILGFSARPRTTYTTARRGCILSVDASLCGMTTSL